MRLGGMEIEREREEREKKGDHGGARERKSIAAYTVNWRGECGPHSTGHDMIVSVFVFVFMYVVCVCVW